MAISLNRSFDHAGPVWLPKQNVLKDYLAKALAVLPVPRLQANYLGWVAVQARSPGAAHVHQHVQKVDPSSCPKWTTSSKAIRNLCCIRSAPGRWLHTSSKYRRIWRYWVTLLNLLRP